MLDDLLVSLRRLSDAELLTRTRNLAGREREATAGLIAHLAELETRGLHLKAGYGSLFVYCRDALGLSEHECFNRIEVARAARRFPIILEQLAQGEVTLTTIRLLAPYLTPENHLAVLAEAQGKKKSAIEEMIARLAPWPDAPPVVRKLPPTRVVSVAIGPGGQALRVTTVTAPAASSMAASSLPLPGGAVLRPGPDPPPATPLAAGPSVDSRSPSVFSVAPKPAVVTPLSPDRYKLQVTIGGVTLEKLRLAKDMLRHALPHGDEAVLLDRALTALLADLARSKFAATDRPRPSNGSALGSRHIPAEVRRAVWLRDLGRCAFVAADGRRCGERAFVEFHHCRPYAVGGTATVDNIQLRCRRHNDYEARLFFVRGDDEGDLVGAKDLSVKASTRSGTS